MGIREFLLQSGIYPNMNGYYPIILAVDYVKESLLKGKKLSITKELYPKIAEKLGTTPTKVERNIRTCVQKIKKEQLKKIGIVNSPSNSEFIYVFAENNIGI